jgi:hypothetical protein
MGISNSGSFAVRQMIFQPPVQAVKVAYGSNSVIE